MNELLAKSTGETLEQHTLAVMDAVRRLVAELPEGVFQTQDLTRTLELCAALHDTGKAATGFQAVLKREQKDWHGRRHEILSTTLAAHCPELDSEARLAI